MSTKYLPQPILKPEVNNLKSWGKVQGYTSAQDEIVSPRRDLNTRYATIENSSERPIGIALTTYCCDEPLPKIQYRLQGGQIEHVGINLPDQPTQYLFLLDPITGEKVGTQYALRTDSNAFVLRDGLQGWYVQPFKRAVYRAGF